MALYKRCEHKGTKRENDCPHEWWGQFMFERKNYRVNLTTWSGETPKGKQQADVILERMRQAIRKRTFREDGERVADAGSKATTGKAFAAVAKSYISDYLEFEKIKGDEIRRVNRMIEHFGQQTFATIATADVRDYIKELRKPTLRAWKTREPRDPEKATKSKARYAKRAPKLYTRSARTVDAYIQRLRHLFNWAIGEGLIASSPFKRGDKVLVAPTNEDNRRHRRLTADEEDRLLVEAPEDLQRLIIAALDSGMRRGEMLSLRFVDLDERPGWIRLPGPNTKSGKLRYVPATARLAKVFEAQRLDAAGRTKAPSAQVFSRGDSSRTVQFETAFRGAKERAGITDLKWHDFRHEFASRLAIDLGRPLPEVQMLLGHSDVTVTMRYVNVMDAHLDRAVAGLDAFARPISTKVAHSAKRSGKQLRLVDKTA